MGITWSVCACRCHSAAPQVIHLHFPSSGAFLSATPHSDECKSLCSWVREMCSVSVPSVLIFTGGDTPFVRSFVEVVQNMGWSPKCDGGAEAPSIFVNDSQTPLVVVTPSYGVDIGLHHFGGGPIGAQFTLAVQ